MHLTVAVSDSDLVVTIECSEGDTVSTIKNQVAAQTGIPAASQALLFEFRQLSNEEILRQVGVSEGDVLMLQRQQEATNSFPTVDASVQEIINRVRGNPQLLANIRQDQPELAAAIERNDLASIQRHMTQVNQEQNARQQELQQLMMNPMDPGAQEKIMESIRQKNVEENFAQAMEHTPEVFGSVTMLYVKIEINGHPVQAFVDSGAQMTIMTEEFAEKIGLLRLVDKRFSGLAVGVGQSKIIGRVHQAPLKISNQYLSSSVVIIEQKDGPPFIFGLDNLIRHQCCIDLESMKLKFGPAGVEVPFLHEHEIQHTDSRLTNNEGPSVSTSGSLDDKIEKLMALGFDRERSRRALEITRGNEEAAASLLFEENAS